MKEDTDTEMQNLQRSPYYAESVAIAGVSASAEFSIRLGRFPNRGVASLWISVFVDGREFSVSNPTLELAGRNAATDVGDHQAVFVGMKDTQSIAHFASSQRNTDRMLASVVARDCVHPTSHPESGPGTEPLAISALFEAHHRGFAARRGRTEYLGMTKATISTPTAEYTIEAPGKWHEQMGVRERFAPAFHYLNVFDSRSGLLAVSSEREDARDWGFLYDGKKATRVVKFDIDPPSGESREFRVLLEDGQRLAGQCVVIRRSSAPIEGIRRPSATVRVNLIGKLAYEWLGHLNDWDPPAK